MSSRRDLVTDAGGPGAIPGTGAWLALTAAPVFGVMALLTSTPGSAAHMSCSAASHLPALGGMGVMYALMSAFHCRPWLRLVSRWRNGSPADARPDAVGA